MDGLPSDVTKLLIGIRESLDTFNLSRDEVLELTSLLQEKYIVVRNPSYGDTAISIPKQLMIVVPDPRLEIVKSAVDARWVSGDVKQLMNDLGLLPVKESQNG